MSTVFRIRLSSLKMFEFGKVGKDFPRETHEQLKMINFIRHQDSGPLAYTSPYTSLNLTLPEYVNIVIHF